ncbi:MULTISPECIES: DotG/IcmE/VirB10 family protein [unclassified Burkholderia]|uniref:DotG/IcmE/VirB10 family protein n=1 Tax=unclassified Burkholderia TaxID=2613784 RepID=UPI002AAF2C53|nr:MULTISPECIES: DotG/IcmE/VirB10 family protein [unclassified Burkholderia]
MSDVSGKIDPTLGAGAAGEPNLRENLKKPLDPGFKRNLKIIGFALGGFAIVIIGLIVFSGTNHANADRSDVRMAGSVVPNEQAMPKPYQDKLNRVESRESVAALDQGKSYVPAPSNDGVQPIQPIQPVTSAATQQVSYVQPTGGGVDQQVPDGLKRQLDRIVASMAPMAPQALDAKIDKAALAATGEHVASSAGSSVSANDASSAPVSRRQLIKKEDIYPAQIKNMPSSDRGGLSFAEITSGPFQGALLQGRSTIYNSDYLNTKFTSMRFNGQQFEIEAIALDEKTAEDALDGKIDHKILTRYVMPVLFAGLQGFATAAANPGSYAAYPSVSTGAGTLITNSGIATPPSSTSQAINAGIAAGLQIANQNISKLANEPVDVSLPQGLNIGVMFTAPVFAQ